MTLQNESANTLHASQAGTLTLGDLTINRLGFGAMRLSANGVRGPARDPEAGRTVLRRAVELGVNHIDTAAFYQSLDGSVRANTLIRETLSPYSPDLVIATKVGLIPGPNGLFTRPPPTCAPRLKTTSRPWAWTALTWYTCALA